MKTYYVADNKYADSIYGDQNPICMDIAEVKRLAKEWDMTTEELLDQMHEATPTETEIYGVYDSSTYTVGIDQNEKTVDIFVD